MRDDAGGAARPSKLVSSTLLRPPYLFLRWGLLGYERFFGQQWIAITTTGRRTGKPHTVLLDVVGYDRDSGRHYIQPGWPRGSDWVKNVEANPIIEAQVGGRRFKARVVRVPGPEGAKWAYRFSQRHPITWLIMARVILGWQPPSQAGEVAVQEWMAKNMVFYAVEPV